MNTIEVSGTNDTSGRPRYHEPPRWLVRATTSCPKCRAWAGHACFGRGRSKTKGVRTGRRKANHAERTRVAKAILAYESMLGA